MRNICVMASSLDIPKKRSNTPTTKSIGVSSSFNSDTSQRGKFGICAILPHRNSRANGFVVYAQHLRGLFGPDGPMSALGHKRTCAVHKRMSALGPKAD